MHTPDMNIKLINYPRVRRPQRGIRVCVGLGAASVVHISSLIRGYYLTEWPRTNAYLFFLLIVDNIGNSLKSKLCNRDYAVIFLEISNFYEI